MALFGRSVVGNRPPRNEELANPRSMPRRHGNRSKLNHALLVYRDLNCLHGFCIKEVCNVKLGINTLYSRTKLKFLYFSGSHATTIHQS